MGFIESVKTVFSKYALFSGRARRSEYWYFATFTYVTSWILVLLFDQWVDIAFTIVTFVPYLAVGVRRLHDTGRSGWNLLWVVIPIIGAFMVLFFLAQDSKKGENQWGPNPKE